MRNLMKTSILSLSILMALTLLFSSCSRQQGAVSYHSEKLQKQSAEIENSTYNYSNSTEASQTAVSTESNKSEAQTIALNKAASVAKGKVESKETKMSVGQKLVLKKLNKKLSPKETVETHGSNIDQKLKLAIIFGIIGIIAGIFSWWLGTILILIALIFLLLWAVENL